MTTPIPCAEPDCDAPATAGLMLQTAAYLENGYVGPTRYFKLCPTHMDALTTDAHAGVFPPNTDPDGDPYVRAEPSDL
jgi:hypothetical protein